MPYKDKAAEKEYQQRRYKQDGERLRLAAAARYRRVKPQLANAYRARKLRLVELAGGRCVDCGLDLTTCTECADFDHVRGEKKYQLSDMGSYAFERVVAELRKCDLVCANCHRTRTHRH